MCNSIQSFSNLISDYKNVLELTDNEEVDLFIDLKKILDSDEKVKSAVMVNQGDFNKEYFYQMAYIFKSIESTNFKKDMSIVTIYQENVPLEIRRAISRRDVEILTPLINEIIEYNLGIFKSTGKFPESVIHVVTIPKTYVNSSSTFQVRVMEMVLSRFLTLFSNLFLGEDWFKKASEYNSVISSIGEVMRESLSESEFNYDFKNIDGDLIKTVMSLCKHFIGEFYRPEVSIKITFSNGKECVVGSGKKEKHMSNSMAMVEGVFEWLERVVWVSLVDYHKGIVPIKFEVL